MRLNLERLDANGLELDLGTLSHERRVTLGTAKGLRGALAQSKDALSLSGVAAESLVLSLLRLKYDAFSIAFESPATLSEVAGSYEQLSTGMDLRLVAGSLRMSDVTVDFGAFQLRGGVTAEKVELYISGSDGRIHAEALQLQGLKLAGSAALGTEQVTAHNVEVSWNPDGYRVEVGDIHLPAATLSLDLSEPAGSAPPRQAAETSARPPRSPEKKQPLVDWEALDGLSGAMDVDLFVDMKVPVIGSRRATHHFRVSINAGTLNYRDLENDLSTLENALLDFAVRDGNLVLERGIPLLPTRGKGKPIVVWPLSDDDFALTSQDRVRLAVLPHGRLVAAEEQAEPHGGEPGGDEPSSDEPSSDEPSVALRELSFENFETFLKLEPRNSSSAVLRRLSFEELSAKGVVHHRAHGEPAGGELTGGVRGLQGSLASMPLGAGQLDLGMLQLGQLANLRIQFRGLHPRTVGFDLTELRVTSLSLGTLSE